MTADPSSAATETDDALFPSLLQRGEADLIRLRREAAHLKDPGLPSMGLALSGGGIRSATFSLGVLQGLAKLKVLRTFDYLSTVSGGGYTGSFLGALYSRVDQDGVGSVGDVEKGLAAPAAPRKKGPKAVYRSVKWLRENGRYLTPGGSGDLFGAAATLARNLLAVHAVMGLLTLFLLLVLDRAGWFLGAASPEPMGFLGSWTLYRSPWLASSFGVLVGGLCLFGAAFWLVPQGPAKGRLDLTRPFWGVLVLWAWTLLVYQLAGRSPALVGLKHTLGFVSFLFTLAFLVVLTNPKALGGDRPLQDKARDRLSGMLRLVGLVLPLAMACYGLVDSVGWTLWYRWFGPGLGLAAHRSFVAWLQLMFSDKGLVVAAASGLVLFRNQLQSLLGSDRAASLWQRALPFLVRLATGVSVVGLAILGLGALSALAHFLTFRPGGWQGHPLIFLGHLEYPLLLLGGLGALLLVVTRVIGFLNLSTLGTLYTSALTRSYLGASNPCRRAGETSPHLIAGDDVPWHEYQPWLKGGPLHLINTTLNETIGGKSQVTQKDRKGMILAVGPAGLSVGALHHALWVERAETALGIHKQEGWRIFHNGGRPFQPEPLTVGQWVGISGAAASTGMGSRTSFAQSLLLGIMNVRLGYWWRTGLEPAPTLRTRFERLLPVHAHLLEEWTARFPGTASRHWYLSDGGHFENTAAYELLRRRLAFILLCDNGADPARDLDDLSNLVHKARLDLAAEVRVLDAQGLKARFGDAIPKGLGSLDELRSPKGSALAALAEVDYLDAAGEVEKTGLILIFKPTMSPAVPLDIQAYQRVNPSFPQQTTADQFFDEAQWESYRRLGEFIALEVLTGLEKLPPSHWFVPPAQLPQPAGPGAEEALEAPAGV